MKGVFGFKKGNIPWNKGKKGLYSSEGKIKDIQGQVFGRLTVIKKSNNKNKCNHIYWECICICGKLKTVSGTNLRLGNVKSCGCLLSDITKKMRRDELSKRIGYSAKSRTFNQYRSVAKQKNREFILTKNQFLEIVVKDCFYCGSSPSNTSKPASKVIANKSFNYNGIDRIDSSKGYVIGNIVPCCKICNIAKRDMTLEKFKDWVYLIYKNMFGGSSGAVVF